jgi:hypothetical protein
MIRGMEGKRIFRDSQDRKDFVTCLEDRSKQTATRILAGSLLGRIQAKIIWILRGESAEFLPLAGNTHAEIGTLAKRIGHIKQKQEILGGVRSK